MKRADDDAESQAAPTAEETNLLVKAFFGIADPDKQAEILALAEQHASGSPLYAEMLQKRTRKQ